MAGATRRRRARDPLRRRKSRCRLSGGQEIVQQFLIPLLFIAVWSTGFIIARAAAPHADLQLFLFLRFLASAIILGIVAAASKAAWPSGRHRAAHVMVGALMLGVYLTCSYWAVSQGLPAGIMSL